MIFAGREALLEQKKRGMRRRLVSFKLAENDTGLSLWGGEGIYCGGELVGKLTSGGIGHSVNGGNSIGIGFVTPLQLLRDPGAPGMSIRDLKAAVTGAEYEIEVGTQRVRAEVEWDALFDPRSSRMTER